MKPEQAHSGKVSYEAPTDAALRALRGHLELGEIEAAMGVYEKSRERIAGWRPPPREWVDLIKGLIEQQAWDGAITVMQHYEKETEAPSSRVRLKLAQLLVQKQERPAQRRRSWSKFRRALFPRRSRVCGCRSRSKPGRCSKTVFWNWATRCNEPEQRHRSAAPGARPTQTKPVLPRVAR